MGRDCTFSGCPNCQWICNCDKSCYKCAVGSRMSCGNGSFSLYNFDGPRLKFCCFDCKHVWKTQYTYETSLEIWDRRNRNRRRGDEYLETAKPKCCKCGKDGIQMGKDFRHCRSDKEWANLRRQIENGTIDAIREFTFCPKNRRERTKSNPTLKWNDTRRETREKKRVYSAPIDRFPGMKPKFL